MKFSLFNSISMMIVIACLYLFVTSGSFVKPMSYSSAVVYLAVVVGLIAFCGFNIIVISKFKGNAMNTFLMAMLMLGMQLTMIFLVMKVDAGIWGYSNILDRMTIGQLQPVLKLTDILSQGTLIIASLLAAVTSILLVVNWIPVFFNGINRKEADKGI